MATINLLTAMPCPKCAQFQIYKILPAGSNSKTILLELLPFVLICDSHVDGDNIIIIFYFIYCVCANYKCCIMPFRGPDLKNKVSCILYTVKIYLQLYASSRSWQPLSH